MTGSFHFCLSVNVILTVVLFQYPPLTCSVFTPFFVWSAVNKSLDEDRLLIVDANNEKVKTRGCARVALYNKGSEAYITTNQSGSGILFVNASDANFATPEVIQDVKEMIDGINPGTCVPCIVIISLVNVSASQEENMYKKTLGNYMEADEIIRQEKIVQDYKLELSQSLLLLLQYKTPIQARHLIMVRLVDKRDDLTKCHGKKYTRYPRRLVSMWEQVLFDHFREARVIQGALESGDENGGNRMLITGKESGIWVWMCEEIIRRLEMQEKCEWKAGESEKEQCRQDIGNLTTANVRMDNRQQCRMYRART